MERNIEREAHVLGICLEHEVDWAFATGSRGRAYRAKRGAAENVRPYITGPQIRGQVSYFTALHELGHILSPGNRDLRVLDREVDAWRWALANSEEEPTPATWRSIDRKLKSYISWALRRKNVAEPSDESRGFMAEIHRMATA